jgi:hypothetical protein
MAMFLIAMLFIRLDKSGLLFFTIIAVAMFVALWILYSFLQRLGFVNLFG